MIAIAALTLAPAAAPAAVILMAEAVVKPRAGESDDSRLKDAAAAKGKEAGDERGDWVLTLAALGAMALALRPKPRETLPQAF